MANREDRPQEYAPGRYNVEFDASQLGPEVDVACLKCGKDIGPGRLGERRELICMDCGICYRIQGTPEAVEVEETRRVVIADDAGQFSAGQAINRPELAGPTTRERVMMVLWAFFLTAVMMAGLWLVVSVWGR